VSLRHIIFDCDGVLVDSEPLSMRVDMELLHGLGVTIGEEEAHRRFVGLTFEAMVGMMERETGRRFPADLTIDKDRLLLALFERELKPVPGMAETLPQLGLPLSVASNSPFNRVAAALRIAGLSPWFGDRITTFEHVPRGKPEPDIFIEAARRAGFAPAECLVIEDSVTGVTAAVRAGCPVLGYTGTHHLRGDHGAKLVAIGAARVFDDMRQLPALLAELA
jgi:HAD superfamily hydrolase (TIGR01509 family)